MKKISIREALKAGWDNFIRKPWFLLWLTIVLVILIVLTTSESLAFSALTFIFYGGYIGILLKHYNWEPVTYDDLVSIDNRWISFTLLGIIKTTVIFVGFFLLVFPGVYLAVRWMFAEILVIDKGMRPMEALKASSAMTKGRMWKLFGFSLVSLVLVCLGFLAFGIGAIVAAIIILFATIKLYRDISTVG